MDLSFFGNLDESQQFSLGCAAVSTLCAVVAVVCAIVQVIFAGKANRVALRIASDQASEAKRARNDAAEAKRETLRHFIETVLAIGNEAQRFTGISLGSWGETQSPNIPSNWRQRLIEYRSALDAIRGASPPDATLLVAVARLGRALDFPSELPQGPYPVEQVLKRVQGSLWEELNLIGHLAIRAGCELSGEQGQANG